MLLLWLLCVCVERESNIKLKGPDTPRWLSAISDYVCLRLIGFAVYSTVLVLLSYWQLHKRPTMLNWHQSSFLVIILLLVWFLVFSCLCLLSWQYEYKEMQNATVSVCNFYQTNSQLIFWAIFFQFGMRTWSSWSPNNSHRHDAISNSWKWLILGKKSQSPGIETFFTNSAASALSRMQGEWKTSLEIFLQSLLTCRLVLGRALHEPNDHTCRRPYQPIDSKINVP